jgi:hypothetical protein
MYFSHVFISASSETRRHSTARRHAGFTSLDCCALAASLANVLAAACMAKPRLRISSGICSAIIAVIAGASALWFGLQVAAPGESRPSRVSAIAAAFALSPAESAVTILPSATRWARILLNMCWRMAGGNSTSRRLSAVSGIIGMDIWLWFCALTDTAAAGVLIIAWRPDFAIAAYFTSMQTLARCQDIFKRNHFVRSSCLLKLLKWPSLTPVVIYRCRRTDRLEYRKTEPRARNPHCSFGNCKSKAASNHRVAHQHHWGNNPWSSLDESLRRKFYAGIDAGSPSGWRGGFQSIQGHRSCSGHRASKTCRVWPSRLCTRTDSRTVQPTVSTNCSATRWSSYNRVTCGVYCGAAQRPSPAFFIAHQVIVET